MVRKCNTSVFGPFEHVDNTHRVQRSKAIVAGRLKHARSAMRCNNECACFKVSSAHERVQM